MGFRRTPNNLLLKGNLGVMASKEAYQFSWLNYLSSGILESRLIKQVTFRMML